MVDRLILVRHGQTDWYRDKRLQGQADIPLNEEGRAEAVRVSEGLARFSPAAVYSSDLQRAAETAEIIAARFKLPVLPRPGLREYNFDLRQGFHRTLRWPGKKNPTYRRNALTTYK